MPNLDSERESYDLEKFNTRKRQSVDEQCMLWHHYLDLASL